MLLAADGEVRRSCWASISIDGKQVLRHAAGLCRPAAVNVFLTAGADEAILDRQGRTPHDAIGVDLGRRGEPPVSRGDEIAVRRMLKEGPAYRARSWARPAEEADGGACGDECAAGVSSPAAASKAPLSVRIFRPKNDRRFSVGLVDRYYRRG